GAYRFARRLVGLRGPAVAAALAYGVNPAARNAVATGRFGPLVFFALLPFVLSRVVRLSHLDDDVSASATVRDETTDDASAAVRTSRPRGRILRLAVLVALATACYPVAPALFIVCAAAFVVVSPLTCGVRASVRALGITVVTGLGAAVLLFPWPLAYATGNFEAPSLGFAFRPDLTLGEVVRFQSGPSGAGWAMWGLVVGAAMPLFLATGPRLAWATRGWALAIAG